jgi:PAS domain S-box-containing protein
MSTLLSAQTARGPVQPSQPAPLHFEHITRKQGLSSESIHAIVQDDQGFLWIGTGDGLFRYDGYRVRPYESDPEQPDSVCGKSVNALHVDRGGTLWIGTASQGVCRFDPTLEQFISVLVSPEEPITTQIAFIHEDNEGMLWVGTLGSGLYRFAPESGEVRRFGHQPVETARGLTGAMRSILEDRSGGVWVGTSEGLYRFDAETEQWTVVWPQPGDQSTVSGVGISSIVEDQSGTIWFANYGQGVLRYDTRTTQVTRFEHDPEDPGSISDGKVVTLHVDRDGTLWAGTFDGVLNRWDPESTSFIKSSHDPLNPSSLSGSGIRALFEDAAGSLWVGTFGSGLSVYHSQRTAFHSYTHHPFDANSLSDSQVRAILQDRDGSVWIGTATGGVNRLDLVSGEFTHFLHDPENPGSLSDNSVYALYEDLAGAIWVGTYSGLNRFDKETQRFVRYFHDPDDPTSLSDNGIRSITGDSQGTMWIGTRDGLDRLEHTTGEFLNVGSDPGMPQSLRESSIGGMLLDTARILWVTTTSSGIYRFDPNTGIWNQLRYDPDDPSSLPANVVNSVYEDRSGRLWFGTSQGLSRLDRHTGRFIRYTEQEGVPTDTVYAILEEPADAEGGAGHLWIGTSEGLFRFNPDARASTNFDSSDGLLNSGDDFLAFLRLRNGELWFGGRNGIDVLGPAGVVTNTYRPPVVLTSLEINNRPVPIGDQITLSHRDRILSLEFAVLNFITPSKNRYAYRLEGFDEDWIETGSDRHRATYTNLDAGNYLFRVRGSNNDGVWNDDGVSLALTVTPPWWGTWWFYALCVSGVLSVFGLLYWVKSAQLQRERTLSATLRERENELQTEIVQREQAEARIRFQSDLLASVQQAVVATDPGGTIIYWNTFAETLYGWSAKDAIGRNVSELIVPQMTAQQAQEIVTTLSTGTGWRGEFVVERRDGTTFPAEMFNSPVYDSAGELVAIIGISLDITGRKQTEETLRASLAEKDVLLRELYHRTRNTLQVIRGMITLQAERLPDNKDVRRLVEDTDDRINAIALVHQMLYAGRDLSQVRMGEYVEELYSQLLTSRDEAKERIKVTTRISDLSLLLDTAVPIGLILNELLTNSLRHAFPDGRRGTIIIGLERRESGQLLLRYTDDGVGVPEGFDFRSGDSLGLTLIHGIAEQQLSGTVRINGTGGIDFSLEFSPTLYPRRI